MRAVIFDLDGVLVDSEPLWHEVRQSYVSERGGRWLPDSQHRMMGMSTGEWSAYLSEELGVGASPAEVADEVIARMAARYARGLPLLPGAVEVVTELAGRWPLGLASSSPRMLIDEIVAVAELGGAFRAIRSTEETSRGKPAPDVYLAVAADLGVDPARCVAVEDSSNGLRSAAAAGMVVIAAASRTYPPDEDALALAAGSVTDLRDLPAAVDRIATR